MNVHAGCSKCGADLWRPHPDKKGVFECINCGTSSDEGMRFSPAAVTEKEKQKANQKREIFSCPFDNYNYYWVEEYMGISEEVAKFNKVKVNWSQMK